MPSIHVTPVGFESFGVRSMCTFVETPDVKLLIDAGVALGPRFRKLPHPREFRARNECRSRIRSYAARADVIVVSHYHNDHHTPNYSETVWIGCSADEAEQIYQDKMVLVKDVRNSINFNQRRRGWMFQRFLKRICARYEAADGKSFDFGATKVVMSRPVPHGEENGEMGWVLMTTVRTSDQVFLHSSDVQGPMSNDTTQLILDQKPVLLVLGGPPFYLKNVRVAESSITRAILNAAKITAAVPITIFDHHALRTESWQMDAKLLYEAAVQSGNRVSTAAEFAGQKNTMLEARREELYKVEPPSASFAKWSELPQEKRRVIVPPV